MASHQTDILISLNNIDKSYLNNSTELALIEKQVIDSEKQVLQNSKRINQLESAHSQAQKNRISEQAKLDQELLKISDRRKQLSSMGGAKSAKLVEREMGIAKKTIEALEQVVLNAIELEEDYHKQLEGIRSESVTLLEKFDKAKSILSEKGNNLKNEIESLLAQKASLTSTLDQRTAALYKRVETRYKGDAIAFAEAGACKSCFRALPAQTFNQIMAGYNLIQCPGCSRLLVHNVIQDSVTPDSAASANMAPEGGK